MLRRAAVCLFFAAPLFAEQQSPAFRAESDHYREPQRIAVQSTALASPAVVLDAPGAAALNAGGDPPRIGIVRTLPEPYGVGQTFLSAPQSNQPHTVAFRSAGAARVRLHLTNVQISGELSVYGRDGMATTFGGNESDLWTPSVDGDTIAIVFGASDRFTVAAVGHIFAKPAPESDACFTDVACNTFADRDTLSRAIAAMEYAKPDGIYVCTGGLINAKVTDRLFLTAHHCISTQAEASSLELTWDFRSTACNSGQSLSTPVTHGATLLATSTTSDVTLLRLPSLPANRVLLGWDTNRPPAGTQLYRIAHPATPAGDAVYQQLYSMSIVNESVNACSGIARPAFLYSTRSVGATGGGSSGSPVITQGGFIVGQLLGACGADPSDHCAASTYVVDGWLGQSYAVLQPFLSPTASSTCTPSSANLCLLANRFKVTLTVSDPRVSGAGYANATTQGDWGYFDVPAATGSNDKPVIFVKLIDGRPVNNRFWVFYGGLTDLQYSFTVTDTQTGATRTYSKASGTYDGRADTEAF